MVPVSNAGSVHHNKTVCEHGMLIVVHASRMQGASNRCTPCYSEKLL